MCADRAVKYQLIQHRLLEPAGSEPDFTRGTLEGDIAASDITFYRLQCDSEGNLRAYIAQGEVLPVATRSFGGIGIFAIPEMGRFYRHVLGVQGVDGLALLDHRLGIGGGGFHLTADGAVHDGGNFSQRLGVVPALLGDGLGLVVTPAMTPMSFAARISLTFAVSIKNFITKDFLSNQSTPGILGGVGQAVGLVSLVAFFAFQARIQAQAANHHITFRTYAAYFADKLIGFCQSQDFICIQMAPLRVKFLLSGNFSLS